MNDAFWIHFIVSSLASSILILLVLFLKRGLKKHIAVKCQYNIDLLFFILLIVPFLPAGLLDVMNMGWMRFNNLFFAETAALNMNAITGGAVQTAGAMNWLQDFTVSVDRGYPGFIAPVFLVLWLTGAFVFAVFTCYCNRELRLVVESMKPIKDGEIAELFNQCKAELGIKRHILFGSSIIAKSPLTVGLFQPRVILPAGIEQTLPREDIRYILLHELMHCKNADVLINNLMCLFQILYWFNPLVFLALREMRLDRELVCDLAVLKRIPREHHIAYGKTLLYFIGKLSRPAALSLAADMGGSKRQIKMRMEGIASFVTESRLLGVKSICVFTLVGALILWQIPTISAIAAYDNDTYRFDNDNVVYEDLSSYFDGYEGSFVLYDLENDQYQIYNRDRSVARVSPASTYKIYSALIAMDAGIIDAAHSAHTWDGTAYPYEVWNQDHNLMSAMQNSVSWYFQDMDAQVGIDKLAAYYSRLSYGNHDLSGSITDYWAESSLRISPIEQVELLKGIYQNNTIFQPEHVEALKTALSLEEKNGATLSGKTGTGSVNGKVVNGWFVGYIENQGRTAIFATNISGEDDAGGSTAVQITLSILEDKGIY